MNFQQSVERYKELVSAREGARSDIARSEAKKEQVESDLSRMESELFEEFGVSTLEEAEALQRKLEDEFVAGIEEVDRRLRGEI